MKIKAAYYPANLPTKIAVKLPDGRVYITDMRPFRCVEASELQPSPVLSNPAYAEKMLEEMPAYVIRFYGFEKEA